MYCEGRAEGNRGSDMMGERWDRQGERWQMGTEQRCKSRHP